MSPFLLSAAHRPAVIVTALLAGLTCQDLWGQREIPPAQVPEAMRNLQHLGELRLKTYSIHGIAPLVMLLTEAPASASEVERRYRHRVTSSLIWNIERLGVSLFSLNPAPRHSDSSDVKGMTHAASVAGEIFRGMKAHDRPQVVIGFADGAIAAARLVLRDSLSAAVVALMPATSNATAGGQERIWQELLRPTDRPRDVLVLESMCNTSSSWLAQADYRQRQTILILPQYDGWLSPRMSSACPASPVHAVGMDYQLTSIVMDWLKRTLIFPE